MFNKTKKFLRDIFIKTDEIEVTCASQPHVLAHWMRKADVSHNETVLADLNHVRVIKGKVEEYQTADNVTLFFCPMSPLIVKRKIALGDGFGIPSELGVKLKDIKAPKPVLMRQDGVYNLTNVILCANGALTVKATKETKWIKLSER